jgi:bacteriorhodopsin
MNNALPAVILIIAGVLIIVAAMIAVIISAPIRWVALGVGIVAAILAGAALAVARKRSQRT